MAAEQHAAIEAEIARLRGLDLDGLRLAWRTAIGRTAPANLSKNLLLRLLAYRLQAQAFGDLSGETRKLLVLLARPGKNGAEVPVPLPGQGKPGPGTVFIREHDGQQHRVMVAADGFVWGGQTYPSLSKVAFAITGTKWNGPRFFGLRAAKS